ncbi:hypothetical protein AB205_0026490, partial [Aquarana catesbeiana]
FFDSLNFSIDLATDLQYQVPETWKDVASKLKLPFDSEINYHPEYENYFVGEKVKQADVVLLGYPLMFQMTPKQRRNDLLIYELVTDPDGPAMTWSMFSIGFMEIKQIDAAETQLKKCFANITEPFKVTDHVPAGACSLCLSSSPPLRVTDHVPAGGRQSGSVTDGEAEQIRKEKKGSGGAYKINKQSLDLDPVVTDEITHLQITGVSYLGNKLNFTFTKSVTTVELTSAHGNPKDSLVISFDQLTPDLPLYIGQPVSFPMKAAHIHTKSTCV